MNAKDFFEKVSEMRSAQKAYFRTRTSTDLSRSKALEREIDNEIERVENIIKPKQDIFNL